MTIDFQQKKILELLSVGKTNKEISENLKISNRTVERRINELFKVYKVNSRLLLAQEYLMEKL